MSEYCKTVGCHRRAKHDVPDHRCWPCSNVIEELTIQQPTLIGTVIKNNKLVKRIITADVDQIMEKEYWKNLETGLISQRVKRSK